MKGTIFHKIWCYVCQIIWFDLYDLSEYDFVLFLFLYIFRFIFIPLRVALSLSLSKRQSVVLSSNQKSESIEIDLCFLRIKPIFCEDINSVDKQSPDYLDVLPKDQ